ncbi:MAG: TraB/GumN family protein, partial [Candidatus Aenigmarchaeota archaeon]|nr:TraB/GumN family protein [Candidatus Aenigmarchaeota archaeon]
VMSPHKWVAYLDGGGLTVADIFEQFTPTGIASGSPRKLDLSKVPPEKLVNQVIELLRKEFPWLHRILIEERNLYMAQRVFQLSQRCQNIVVVVGAGHAKGIAEILNSKAAKPTSFSQFD